MGLGARRADERWERDMSVSDVQGESVRPAEQDGAQEASRDATAEADALTEAIAATTTARHVVRVDPYLDDKRREERLAELDDAIDVLRQMRRDRRAPFPMPPPKLAVTSIWDDVV